MKSVSVHIGQPGEQEMIRKLIIIAVLAAIAYGAYRWMDASDFWGTRDQKRKTFEDVERQALE